MRAARAFGTLGMLAALVPLGHASAQSNASSAGAPLMPVATPISPVPGFASSDPALPPWIDPGDVPPPAWVRSVKPVREAAAFYAEPGKLDARRGSAQLGARLPFFGAKRAPGCQGRWLSVGPAAWICSDVADYAEDTPGAPSLGFRSWLVSGRDATRPTRPGSASLPPVEPSEAADDGLPHRYYFAGRDGAYGYANLARALEDAADQELEPGFAVAVTEERSAHGEPWGKTTKGRWIALRELSAARPSRFHGERIEGPLDVAWVVADKANLYPEAPAKGKALPKPTSTRTRFERVRVKGEREDFVEVEISGLTGYMRARELGRARLAVPPEGIDVAANERWIDVDLAQQTLTAYEGARPVFATLVSTGKGPPGSESATRPGVHRIWVKLFTTKMDNLDKDDVDRHFAIEDVPWVQFFDKAIGLHAAFWHRDFGRMHSHGCVNLTPIDARWLFAFTGPHLPAGWTAVLPAKPEPGTVVRVR